eukprot:scaffold31869_cov62-Phaeocystis_antarctica.AAC.3
MNNVSFAQLTARCLDAAELLCWAAFCLVKLLRCGRRGPSRAPLVGRPPPTGRALRPARPSTAPRCAAYVAAS